MPFAMTLIDNKRKLGLKMKGLIMFVHVHLGTDENLYPLD